MLGCHNVLAVVHFDGKRRTCPFSRSNLKGLAQNLDRHRVCRVRPNSLLVHARLFLLPFARSRSLGSTQDPRSQKPCPGNLQAKPSGPSAHCNCSVTYRPQTRQAADRLAHQTQALHLRPA